MLENINRKKSYIEYNDKGNVILQKDKHQTTHYEYNDNNKEIYHKTTNNKNELLFESVKLYDDENNQPLQNILFDIKGACIEIEQFSTKSNKIRKYELIKIYIKEEYLNEININLDTNFKNSIIKQVYENILKKDYGFINLESKKIGLLSSEKIQEFVYYNEFTEYNDKGNCIYYENSNGYKSNIKYDKNNNIKECIETSKGQIVKHDEYIYQNNNLVSCMDNINDILKRYNQMGQLIYIYYGSSNKEEFYVNGKLKEIKYTYDGIQVTYYADYKIKNIISTLGDQNVYFEKENNKIVGCKIQSLGTSTIYLKELKNRKDDK